MQMRLIDPLPEEEVHRLDAEETRNGTFYFSADGPPFSSSTTYYREKSGRNWAIENEGP